MIENRYEARLVSFLRAIPARTWYAVLAALLAGVLAHLAALTGIIVNGDNTVPVVSGKWLILQGKWANGYLADLRGLVNMNIVTGLLGIIWLSIAAGLVVSTLRIRSRALSALTGMMLVTFPSVLCTFLYNAPDIFFFALLLAALSAYCAVRFRYGFIASIPLLTVSIGIYQTYIGFAAGLFVLVALFDLLAGEKPLRDIIKKGLLYIGVLLVSVALYYGILLLFIGSPENLQSYRSMNQMGAFSLSEIVAFTKAAYRKVLRFFLLDAYGVIGSGTGRVLYRITLALCAVLGVAQAVRRKLWRTPLNLCLALALALVFPVAIHAIVILGKNADTHWIMIYPFVLVFVALMKLADMSGDAVSGEMRAPSKTREGGQFLTKLVPALLSVMLICSWYLITTQNYARMRLAYEGAYGTCAVIAAGVVGADAFTEETPVAMVGYIADDSEDFAFLDNFTGSFDRDYLFNSWIVQRMIVRFVQIPMTFVTVEDKERILSEDWFSEMPAYPNKGYIAEHDGMLVVKLSPDEPVIFG